MLANSNIHGGAPETLVFLHHFGGSSRSWREVIARLPNFRGFAPDLRGFGAAPDVPENWSVDAAVDDIAAHHCVVAILLAAGPGVFQTSLPICV